MHKIYRVIEAFSTPDYTYTFIVNDLTINDNNQLNKLYNIYRGYL